MSYEIPSVALATRALKLLSRYRHQQCTLTEIAALLQTNKTTCLRVLRTLQQEDFIRYDEDTKRYSLGPYLIPLGNRAAELGSTASLCIAELPQVAAKTNMTTVLVKRWHNHRLMYVASAEPPNDEVRISVSVGQEFPGTGAAFGMCFIAYDAETVWHEMVAKGLPRYTVNTLVDGSSFVDRLRQIRALGYAVSHGEVTLGVSAVAAPVFNRTGEVEWTIACLRMTSQMTPDIEQTAISTLCEAAGRLSTWNGFEARVAPQF